MSLNYQKDPTAQYPTLPTGLDGADSVVRFYEQGTDEMKNLLKNECSLIYECSYCRSLFRSVINFVSHKRTICRSLQTSVRMELELGKQVGEATSKADKDEEADTVAGGTGTSTPSAAARSKRNPNSLRRVNLASVLGKHIQNFDVPLEEANTSIEVQTLPKISRSTPVTAFKDGRQIVENIPQNLAIKERVPENRTVLVMPQDITTRYGEMKLRNRKTAEAGLAIREISDQEIKIMENIPQHIHEHADFQALKCLSVECAHMAAFKCVEMFAYHLAIYHHYEEKESCKCYICGADFNS